MKLYTSYWAQVRNFPKNLVGLNTTFWPPKWRPLGQDKRGVWVIDCPIVKPGEACEGLCNGKCSPKHPWDCEFLKVYYDQLMKIDFEKFMESLYKLREKISAGEGLDNIDFAFIFFETPRNECSERWPFLSWMKNYSIDIEEWKTNI